jgi:uncharacterized protein (TIGR02270 family)
MADTEQAPILPDIVAQHAAEAPFLWFLRDRAVSAPQYLLSDLVRLDDRVEAHLDGLRIAGPAGWEIARQALGPGDAGEVFALAVLAFEEGNKAKIQGVMTVGTASPDLERGIVSALGWIGYERASARIRPLLADESTVLRRIGVAAAAIHRRNPGPAVLNAALASDDPLLKARALRAAGELGLVEFHIAARSNLRAKDPAVRFWAAWSNGLLSGHKDGVSYLQSVAEASDPRSEAAVQMAVRRLAPNDAKIWLKRLVRDLDQKRIAIIAAGAIADPEAIPFLLEQMKDPEQARVAGESFCLITGADLGRDKLKTDKPEGFESGPNENPEDENVAMDPDEFLPWPDVDRVRKWWTDHQGNFAKGTRHLLGQPITPESLREALKKGYQRQRAAAAIELAILKPGRPLFEVRAPGFRQRQMLQS